MVNLPGSFDAVTAAAAAAPAIAGFCSRLEKSEVAGNEAARDRFCVVEARKLPFLLRSSSGSGEKLDTASSGYIESLSSPITLESIECLDPGSLGGSMGEEGT